MLSPITEIKSGTQPKKEVKFSQYLSLFQFLLCNKHHDKKIIDTF